MAEFRPVNLAEIFGQVDEANARKAQMQNNAMMQDRQRRQFAMEDEAINKQRKIGDIYRNRMNNVDGQIEFDESGYISDLANVDPFEARKELEAIKKRKQEEVKFKNESTKADLDNRKALSGYIRDLAPSVVDQASYDAFLAESSALGANFVKSAPREFNPDYMRSVALDSSKFVEMNTPKYEKVDLGGKIQLIDTNPFTNPSIKGTSLDKTATPEAIMTDKRTREEGALNRGVTIRGQNMTDARARETGNATGAPVAVIGADGLPTYVNRNDAIGKQPYNASATAQGSPAQKLNDAKDVLQILKQAAPLIKKSTGSGLGSMVDNSAAFFGSTTEGARNAASLKALEGTLVSKMPKMSGPQSDKDVLLYKQMAGQIGDPNIPSEQKQAAMDTINELNSRYAGVPLEPLDYGNKTQTPRGGSKQKVFNEADKILGL